MAYDEVLAQRIHDLLDGEEALTSRAMFGGLGFMVDGHLAVAAGSSGELMVRADPVDAAQWLSEHVQPMEMRGRAMSGWLLVDRAVLADDEQLGMWVDRGVARARTLPPDSPGASADVMALDRIMRLHLAFPTHLSPADRATLTVLAERNLADHGDGFLGLVLSGSAGRGMATDISDLDAFVVLSDDAAAGRTTAHAPDVDEIPWSRSELDTVGAFGTEEWWSRWSCAWAPVLLDRTGGDLTEALRQQATLSPDEADALLIEHDRLDGWVNFAYRALKSDRDGRVLESRLDACESLPWLLDVVFTIAGRVRPYNKYLPWELRTHPVDGWPADQLLGLVERTLVGDVDAIRETFPMVRAACAAYDERRGQTRTTDMINGWGSDLELFA